MPYTQKWIQRGSEQIGLQWYEPPEAPDAPMMVVLPAMGVPARYYRPIATGLREAGTAVVVVDLRGTGASTPRPSRSSRYGYAELVEDVDAVLDTVAPHREGRRLVLMGHSLGGQACVLHLARSKSDPRVDGVALVGAGLPYWRSFQDFPQRMLALPFTQAIGATAALLRIWPGWGFGGRQAHGVIRDWAYTARTGRFPELWGEDPAPAVAAIHTPVLAVSLDRDQYVSASVVDQLVQMLPAARVRRHHCTGGLDHFSWARSETSPLVEHLAAFAATG